MGRLWATLMLAVNPCAAADLPSVIDALMGASPVARASVGIHVVDLKSGNALYSRNAERLYLPASNMKLFTAALALERLGPEYRRHVEDSWLRMVMEPDRALVEAGLWRARLDDLLVQRPERCAEVAAVIDEATTFLRHS